MQNTGKRNIFTTVSIDKETGNLADRICKHFRGKRVKL